MGCRIIEAPLQNCQDNAAGDNWWKKANFRLTAAATGSSFVTDLVIFTTLDIS